MKIPDSISAMVYDMKYPWMWTIFIWTLAFIGLFNMLPCNELYESIAFLSCGCLGLLGAVPLIKGEKNTAHYILAIIAGILSQVWVLLENPKSLIVWILFPILILTPSFSQKWCFIVEIICLISLIITFFLTSFNF